MAKPSQTLQVLQHLHDHALQQKQATEVLIELVRRILRKSGKIMATVEEVQARLDASLAKLEANTAVLPGISTYIAEVRAELADVKRQLQELIDAGNSPPELAGVVEKLDALDAGLDGQAIKAAAVLNTPDDPND